MIDILLGLFAVAMLFACVRHVRALLRRRAVLREMYRAMDEAAENKEPASLLTRSDDSVTLSGEHPFVRGVFVESAPELRREKRTTDADPSESGRVAI